MPEVKWIKLLTSLPDDEKMKTVELMPERYAIFYVWVRLLLQAGKCNEGGMIYLSGEIPFTEQELANQFSMPVNILKLALLTYERLGMIEIGHNGSIFIPNFAQIQNLEGMEKIKKQGVLRQQQYRLRLKESKNVTHNGDVTVTPGDATDIDIDIDIELLRSIYTVWNEEKIIVHQKLNDSIKSAIKTAVNNYSSELIITSIKNYGLIVGDDSFWFKYKWTLKDFLKRGIEKFTDLEVAKSNYRVEGKINGTHQQNDQELEHNKFRTQKYGNIARNAGGNQE